MSTLGHVNIWSGSSPMSNSHASFLTPVDRSPFCEIWSWKNRILPSRHVLSTSVHLAIAQTDSISLQDWPRYTILFCVPPFCDSPTLTYFFFYLKVIHVCSKEGNDDVLLWRYPEQIDRISLSSARIWCSAEIVGRSLFLSLQWYFCNVKKGPQEQTWPSWLHWLFDAYYPWQPEEIRSVQVRIPILQWTA